jgi:hypothetical protein
MEHTSTKIISSTSSTSNSSRGISRTGTDRGAGVRHLR